MKSVPVILLLWASAAFAEDAQPAAVTLPKAANSHLCTSAAAKFAQAMQGGDVRAVKLGFLVGTDGTVKDPVVLISSEDALADSLALQCVRDWRYNPATRNGQPVEATWEATVSLSIDGGADPGNGEYDTAASDPAVQSCTTKPVPEMEARWSNDSRSAWSKPLGDNDGFECLRIGNANLVCRAKPGTALYPTIVVTTFYSTGAKLKLSIGIQTARDCKAALPIMFKDKVPTR